VGEVVFLDETLDALELLDLLERRHADEPARHSGFDENADLVYVTDEILVDGPHPRAPIGGDDDEALPPQELQRLAYRIGRGAVAAREIGDDQPLVGLEAALDDVLADQLVNGRPGPRGARRIDADRRLCLELVHRSG